MKILDRPRAVFAMPAAHRTRLLDVAIAVVTTGLELGMLFDGDPSVQVSAVVLTVAGGAALLARRRHGLLVLAATIAAAWATAAIGAYPGGAPVLVALYSVAETRERRVSVAIAVPVALFLLLASISSLPISAAAWALGSYTQTRRRYVAALEERAAHLEREREQLSAIAARDERTAIARELHDIVAHSVTVMLLGVRGARDVLPTDPEVAGRTLDRVETVAEDSLVELRRMLTALRDPHQDPQLAPQPALTGLDALTAGYRDAGMPVTLTVTGDRRTLPGGVELSVYRIVEEALTNVLKHAEPHRVEVLLAFERGGLSVEVRDDGPPRPAGAAGHGLAGMRERITVLGGRLTTGPRPEGGFAVSAWIPVAER